MLSIRAPPRPASTTPTAASRGMPTEAGELGLAEEYAEHQAETAETKHDVVAGFEPAPVLVVIH
ncbi:hypothetical protein GCM10009664_72180 [Kitasatospora gansuensis]